MSDFDRIVSYMLTTRCCDLQTVAIALGLTIEQVRQAIRKGH